MAERQNLASGGPWEDLVGYSRAVRVGTRVYVSGTTAIDSEGNLVGEGDAYTQAAQCICNLQNALERLGSALSQVVRTRMFVTDISRWREFGRAHGEAFDSIRPCATMVEVRALIHPDMLIEIEAEADIP